MKRIILFAATILVVWACSAPKQTGKTSVMLSKDSIDSTEYDIIVIDPQFEQWYLTNYSPAKDRTNDFYREKDRVGANNWNEYFHTAKYSGIIESNINYYPDIDYGIDVNRKLYWYFRYVEETYGIRLF